MGKHRNSFEGGLLQDRADAFAPPNTYFSALNVVHESEKTSGAGLTNEQSNKLAVDVGGDIVGTTYIEQIKKSILFVEKDGSSIYLFDHINYSLDFVMSDSEFGCNWGFNQCEFMYAEVKEHNACDDIYIYFSSNCKYHVVNITEMLDPVRKQAIKECEDCLYFDLVQPICTPVINATPIQYGGTTLESGAVAFSVRLTDNDGNYTNWFAISSTTILRSENNFPGEQSINAVELSFTGLDSRYEFLEIAVVKTGAGVTTVEVLPKMAYSGTTYGYKYYGQKGFPADISQITAKTKAYLQGRDLLQHDGRLFFYNLKREKNLNYQKYANNISVSGRVYPVPLKTQIKYRFPSLQRGECYRFGIVWNYADGTHSKAFAILGDAASSSIGRSVSAPKDFVRKTLTYNTANEFERKRNPNNRGTENESLEQGIKTDIENIDTNENDLKDSAIQLDAGNNPFCCDVVGNVIPDPNTPTTATDAIGDDIDDVSNMFQNMFETFAQMGQDTPTDEVTVGQTSSLKDASIKLYQDGVVNREYVETKTPVLSSEEIQPASPQTTLKRVETRFRGDNWIDINGREVTDERITGAESIRFSKEFNNLLFPDFKDCEGQRMFPQGNLFSFKVPDTKEWPHYSVNNSGVVNNFQPSNDPYSDVTIWLMGAEFFNIHIPTKDELPKPLCPTTPYTIVYVKRDVDNSKVIANGWTGGTELGENKGKFYNFQRHGVNSQDNVFRGVDRSGSRKTRGRSIPAYTFHSPDTDFTQGRLDATKVNHHFNLNGSGWRYGIYAKGMEPDDSWTGQRVDQRGARIANNLTGYTRVQGTTSYDLKGISYTKNGTVTQASGTMQYPLDNVYNESSVYFEIPSILPGNERDKSFLGDTLTHQGQLYCNSAYVSLIRDLDQQYGPISNSAYISLGVRGGWKDGQVVTQTEGICGDIFIGPYSKRRTSFVSEKVGDKYSVPPKPGSSPRLRTICELPDDHIFELLGLNVNQTALPESGDRYDPRNHAGLYTETTEATIPGAEVISTTTYGHQDVIDNFSAPLSDIYYPGTVTGVVYSIVESRVCPWERVTGDPKQDQIYPEQLKGYNLDSAASEVRPWENCYLNNVNYVPVFQPSRKQLANIALVRNIVMLLIPATALAGLTDIESVFDAVATMFVSTGISSLFMLAAHTLFTPESLRRLFGIEPCYTDSQGAWKYFKSERHKDNWNRYNFDFSKITTETQYLGINSLYNTCDCDNCTKDDINQRGGETNKEIYFSAKQNLDTEIDAYRNIKIGAYNELPVHSGNIRKMFLQNNNMYVHTTKGIWMVQMAAGNWPADIGSQLTGTGDLLMRPVLMLDVGSGSEGYAGTNHPNASINIPGYGYFFVDDVAKKVYQFDGSPKAISDMGMRKFFNQHLDFCSNQGCYDEVESPKFAMGWDHKYNRLLLTKKDGNKEGSFTISYSPIGEGGRGKWISFHSYIPDFYMRDRFNMFSVEDNQIWVHNVQKSYQSFYGQKYPMFIQSTFMNPETYKYFELKNIKVFSEATRGRATMLDKTFNKMALWNYKDSTGVLTLNVSSDRFIDNNSQKTLAQDKSPEVEIIRNSDIFLINNLPNRFDLTCDEFVLKEDLYNCAVIEDIEHSTECLTEHRQDYTRRHMGGRWLNVRFIYEDVDDTELTTQFIEWEEEGTIQSVS